MQKIEDRSETKYYLITLKVNGDSYTREVKANTLQVNFLREELYLTWNKKG